MGSFFKSLALAAALAASDAQSAAPTQREDTQTLKNKKAAAVLVALEALQTSTPADKSTAKIEELKGLVRDGEVSTTDEIAMKSFGSAVHKAGNPVGLDGRPDGAQDRFGLNDELAKLAEALAMKENTETTTPPKPETNPNSIGGEGADAQNNNQEDQKLEVKPAHVADKLPPLNETKEQKKMRLEEERLAKVRKDILIEMNKEIKKTDKWKSLLPGQDGNDSAVKAENSNGGIRFSIGKDKKKGQTTYRKELPAGEYLVKADVSGKGKVGIWWKGGKEIPLTSGQVIHFTITEPTEVDIYAKLSSIGQDAVVDNFQITEPTEVKIVQGAQ